LRKRTAAKKCWLERGGRRGCDKALENITVNAIARRTADLRSKSRRGTQKPLYRLPAAIESMRKTLMGAVIEQREVGPPAPGFEDQLKGG